MSASIIYKMLLPMLLIMLGMALLLTPKVNPVAKITEISISTNNNPNNNISPMTSINPAVVSQ